MHRAWVLGVARSVAVSGPPLSTSEAGVLDVLWASLPAPAASGGGCTRRCPLEQGRGLCGYRSRVDGGHGGLAQQGHGEWVPTVTSSLVLSTSVARQLPGQPSRTQEEGTVLV